ncbi:YbaB/EbfC family nucleoid-associated protein [Chlorobaculum tepidum]|jgi:DNA-binding YbaB/EbfC family protein|uniref:Nucleoid-associated protein CT0805 n=1 Tax=Chlorobaculum tepidum (strain ATCC 49652 / DSM 12025 / NBRC 103806 / TLS) TaxID=194439 RepID=Y805_CHLTE|nr:YbaB/EbfC family nucleoid-associated protein [Chlorobaculum tepidum]Q8KE85.2 RecName: Full=Nucleoid-associated protein CT0805 [Chlorobaculum tepidum TLS]
MAMPNFGDMMKQLQEAGAKMQDLQKQLEKLVSEGEAGGGMVRAKVNGRQKLLELTIDPEIMDDVDMVQDLVVAAVNKALEASAQLAQSEIQKAAGGMINPADLMKQFGGQG